MLNFPSALDTSGTTVITGATSVAPVVAESVVIRRPETRVTDIGKAPQNWTWEDLRNYVVRSIESTHGPFPRDAIKEQSIFSSFHGRWGVQAGLIAQFAFGECKGMWQGAPVRVQRFCKASDPYFAAPIAERLMN